MPDMPNRLADETSPYLQQHAANPVDWYPWGPEALGRARSEDKPILLSIGYSACHWCHVMAHESFEDPQIAALMNRDYVNIKVDREERPDLDQIYQTAHQMLASGAGGWPLTMFLAPDGTPFFGGTYFPKTSRYGLPGFGDMLGRIAEIWRDRRSEIGQQNAQLRTAFARTLPAGGGHRSEFSDAPLQAMLRHLQANFDARYGGFGGAPKFPHPGDLEFCLRRGEARIVQTTLTRMCEGGIYDQLGGGFSRYSVDQYWMIPHFEKMLYDNGPLLGLLADAWLQTQQPLYRRCAGETAAWIMREMQSPEGGYYSSLDADSEHEEGRYYVWTPDEVRRLLTPEEYSVVEPHYGLDGPPNFEGRHWHLRVMKPLAFIARKLGLPLQECESRLASARAKLLAAREQRVRPGRDEKALASWNALMARGMARAARVFGEPAWLASARRALDFMRRTLWRNGRLLATYKDGHAHLNAYLDDHAFLLDAALELMQGEFRAEDLSLARELAEILLAQFEDRAAGGFFFVSHDHETLIHRAKPGHDNATPSGNGIAAAALQRLGHLIGEPRYLEAAERALKLFYPALERQPSAFVSLATALEEHLAPPQIVIVRGGKEQVVEWRRALARVYRPATLVVSIAYGAGGLPPALDKPAPPDGAGVNAWVCRGVTCLPPISNLNELEQALAGDGAR